MNPLDLPGPQFLALYFCLALVAIALSTWIVWAARPPNDEPPAEAMELDPYETAFLAGQEEQAAHAAIARLLQRGTLTLNEEKRLKVGGRLADTAHPLESAIYEAVAAGEDGRKVDAVFKTGV